MKVIHMRTDKGNSARDQHIIYYEGRVYFQSYGAIIALKDMGRIFLDERYWKASRTTIRYRNKFIGLSSKEIEESVEEGHFILADLN